MLGSEKYKLAISESLTLKDIERLLGAGQPTAIKIRNDAIVCCEQNNIQVYTRSVPTEAVLLAVRKDIKYFYDKMQLESKLLCA